MGVVICSSTGEVTESAAAKITRVCRDAGPDVVLGVAISPSPPAL